MYFLLKKKNILSQVKKLLNPCDDAGCCCDTKILKFYSSQQFYKVPTPCRLSVVPSDGRHRCLGNDCKKTRKYHILVCSIIYEKTENNFANSYFSRHIEERKKNTVFLTFVPRVLRFSRCREA